MARLRSNAVAHAPENDAQVIDDASVDGLRQRVAALEEEKQKLQQLVEYRSMFRSRPWRDRPGNKMFDLATRRHRNYRRSSPIGSSLDRLFTILSPMRLREVRKLPR